MKRRRGCEKTISLILGPCAEVLNFWDFVRKYAPELDTTSSSTVFAERSSSAKKDSTSSSSSPKTVSMVETTLQQVHVHPSEGCTPSSKVTRARRSQSLATLVDDVVWSLLQRRERLNNVNQQGNNLLCLGYKLGSDVVNSWGVPGQPCRNMPLGMRMTHINHHVDYCKTSDLFSAIHALVGDDVLRLMLMTCSVFIPTDVKDGKLGNFMQVCGPPLQHRVQWIDQGIHSQRKRKRRRRNPARTRREEPSVQPCSTSHVSRKSLFYADGFTRRVGLPSNHLLNGPEQPEVLLDRLVHLSDSQGRRRRRRWLRVKDGGHPLCRDIFRRHRDCSYKRLLEHYCPLPDRNGVEWTIADASAAHTDPNRVVSFVRSVFVRVFPEDLFGCPSNWKLLLDHHLDWFVKLRRFETCDVKSLCHGIRVTKIPWLFKSGVGKPISRSDHESANELLACVFTWTFQQFIVPLLRTSFYITEAEFSGRQVLYYRKPVWSIFRSLSMKKLLNDQYVELTEQETIGRLGQQEMGLCRLRLLPKETGVRPIAMLSKAVHLRLRTSTNNSIDDPQLEECIESAGAPARKRPMIDPLLLHAAVPSFLSTNRMLENACSVLRFEYSRRRELSGAGLDGLHYFYPTYRRFLERRRTLGQNRTPIFFASVDVDRCYDNINQDHMIDVLRRVLSEDDYIVQQYDAIYLFESMNKVIHLRRKKVGPPDDFVQFYGSSSELASEQHRCIFVDKVTCSVSRKEVLMKLLKEHLTSHLVVSKGRYGSRYLLQRTGIPQGSVLSSLLNDFYYGNVEQSILPELFQGASHGGSETDDSEHLLVRMVDDFMLVTSDVAKLTGFLRTMYRGNASLGVQINEEKSKVSTKVSFETSDGDTRHLGHDPCSRKQDFSWCGMCFNVITGEVGVDYSRFHRGRGRDTLTVEHAKNQGSRLKIAMKTFVRPRCLPIFFDSSINTSKTQRINFYQLHVLSAVRTVDYIRSSSLLRTLESNLSFLSACIDSTIAYSVSLVASRLRHCGAPQTMQISRSHANWLGWMAYHDVLCRFSEFQTLVGRLQERLKNQPVPSHVHKSASEGKRRIQIDCFFS